MSNQVFTNSTIKYKCVRLFIFIIELCMVLWSLTTQCCLDLSLYPLLFSNFLRSSSFVSFSALSVPSRIAVSYFPVYLSTFQLSLLKPLLLLVLLPLLCLAFNQRPVSYTHLDVYKRQAETILGEKTLQIMWLVLCFGHPLGTHYYKLRRYGARKHFKLCG